MTIHVPDPVTAGPVSHRPRSSPINLALQGGGAHGAFGWGVLDRILEDGRLTIEGFSATSAGAMNAVVYAYGRMTGGVDGARDALDRFWRRVSDAGSLASPLGGSAMRTWLDSLGLGQPTAFRMFETMTQVFSPYELNPLNLNPLRSVLEAVVDFEAVRHDDCTRLRLCATSVRTGKARVFSNAELTTDMVLASACLPLLFQAIEIDGEAYWDGGFIGNPAIYPLIYDMTAPDILIVHINPIIRHTLPRRASEILNRINEISFNSSLMREMRAIAFVSKLIDDGWVTAEAADRLKRVFIHAIRADDVLAAYSVETKYQTDWSFLTKLRDLGRSVAGEWLDAHAPDVGRRSTVDIRAEYL